MLRSNNSYSNVIAELGKVVDAIPSSLYNKEDMLIYVSQNIARAYVRALGGFGSFLNGENNSGIGAQGTMWYNGGAGLFLMEFLLLLQMDLQTTQW